MTNADKWCFVYDMVRSYQIMFYLQNEGISYRTKRGRAASLYMLDMQDEYKDLEPDFSEVLEAYIEAVAEYKKGYYFTDKYYHFRTVLATLVKEHIK